MTTRLFNFKPLWKPQPRHRNRETKAIAKLHAQLPCLLFVLKPLADIWFRDDLKSVLYWVTKRNTDTHMRFVSFPTGRLLSLDLTHCESALRSTTLIYTSLQWGRDCMKNRPHQSQPPRSHALALLAGTPSNQIESSITSPCLSLSVAERLWHYCADLHQTFFFSNTVLSVDLCGFVVRGKISPAGVKVLF